MQRSKELERLVLKGRNHLDQLDTDCRVIERELACLMESSCKLSEVSDLESQVNERQQARDAARQKLRKLEQQRFADSCALEIPS